MYYAPYSRKEDEALLLDHLRAHPFVTLCAVDAGRPMVANAPVLVRRIGDGLVLDFHLSRGNAFAPFLEKGVEAVAISLAADAYVSPDWYEADDQVPTWNYATVEAQGRLSVLDDAGLVALLDDLSDQEEAKLSPKPVWTRDKMSPGRFEAMARAIVGVRLTVERLEGTYKLGQNKKAADRAGVIAALGDHPIASLMQRH